MADTSTTTPEQKRSQLLQADAAMASLQGDIEKRRDNNLAKIQSTFDTLHRSIDERMHVLKKQVEDEAFNSLGLINERREQFKSMCSKLEHMASQDNEFTEEQITEINKQYTELQGGVVRRIYKTTEVSLQQADSVTNTIESLGQLQSSIIPTVSLTKSSVDDINIPKGKNSSFAVTLRDDEGRVLGGCADSIKVTVVATGKGKIHLQETAIVEEQPAVGNYLVKYSPKSIATYQVTTLISVIM